MINPFGHNGELSPCWHGDIRSVDGTPNDRFSKSDVEVVLYEGEQGDQWDGIGAAVFRLTDGRLVAYETFWGPTGDGFHEDAYGGDAVLWVGRDLRLLINTALTDEGRRLAGIPEELWNRTADGS